MSRRVAALVVAAAALIVLAGVVALWRRGPRPAEGSTGALESRLAESPRQPWQATLWLPSESERLGALGVRVESGAEPTERGRALVTALLSARPEPPLDAIFPIPVRLGRLLVIDGTAYVDLRPEQGGEPPSTGSRLELLRVYSLVQTLVANVPEIRRVVLLWNGSQRAGFPGHVDTSHPLVPRPELVEG